MEEALTSIVTKMFELNFRDDEYRNNSEGNRLIGLQYFFKRQEGSSWEVYSTYNPNNGLLSLHYYDIYGNEPLYPVFFISIHDDHDAETACRLLELKTNYLWAKESKKVRHPADKINAAIRRLGYTSRGSENNITTWHKATEEGSKTLLVENGVSLSLYLFSADSKGKAKPIVSLRNIQEEGGWEQAIAYVKRKSE